LRLDPLTVTRLRRVGIRRIGELARLPKADLTAGFGRTPVLRLAQAFGHAPEGLRFITAPPDWQEIEYHAEPILTPAQLLGSLARLTDRLCARLGAASRGATSLIARFHRIDLRCPEISLGFAAPCRDDAQIGRLLKEKLTGIDPGFGIESISLTADDTETLAPAQQGMEAPLPDYSRPIDTLLNRLGRERLWRAAAHESHIPEFSVRRSAITSPAAPWDRPRHPRPVTLLPRPDVITAIALVPDDPPVQFSWRGKTHRIRRATGPERIAREWWRHDHNGTRPEHEHIRDYYAVEDNEGARFWVFRTGLHEGTAPVRWFLHGFFG
jgi:protein ImuB